MPIASGLRIGGIHRLHVLLAAALVVVWPLAHLIALRNVLLWTLFLCLMVDAVRHPQVRSLPAESTKLMAVLAALFGWILCVALLVDHDPLRSLGEIRAEWLPPYLSVAAGAMLLSSVAARGANAQSALRALFYALLSLPVARIAIDAWSIAPGSHVPGEFFDQLSAHKSYTSYVTAIAASLLLADVVATGSERRPLALSATAWWLAFGAVVLATYLAKARNGMVVLLFLGLLAGVLYLRRRWNPSSRRAWIVAGVLGMCLVAGAWVMFKSDARWARLIATIPVAWNIDAYDGWVDVNSKPLPNGADGLPVEATAYERISWARAAVRFLGEHPLGTAVTRDAFRQLMEARYGHTRAAHSHNGYLDLGLSIGIPGLALWIVFCALLLWRGFTAGIRGTSGSALALFLLVAGFSLRAAMDSTLRDHMLEEFMFFAGFLLAASANESKGASGNG